MNVCLYMRAHMCFGKIYVFVNTCIINHMFTYKNTCVYRHSSSYVRVHRNGHVFTDNCLSCVSVVASAPAPSRTPCHHTLSRAQHLLPATNASLPPPSTPLHELSECKSPLHSSHASTWIFLLYLRFIVSVQQERILCVRLWIRIDLGRHIFDCASSLQFLKIVQVESCAANLTYLKKS